jgi:hypothetical protein
MTFRQAAGLLNVSPFTPTTSIAATDTTAMANVRDYLRAEALDPKLNCAASASSSATPTSAASG